MQKKGNYNDINFEYMKLAIKMAKESYLNDDVPVGAVLYYKNNITTGFNDKITSKLVSSHAEINAINLMCEKIGDWRLNGGVLYVTIFPCLMCIGTIIEARISKVVFGSINYNNYKYKYLLINAGIEIVGPICDDSCSKFLSNFFKEKRQ